MEGDECEGTRKGTEGERDKVDKGGCEGIVSMPTSGQRGSQMSGGAILTGKCWEGGAECSIAKAM